MRAEREELVRMILPRFSRLNNKPRCLHYAPSLEDFKQIHPEYLFCSNCVAVSNDFTLSTNANMNLNSDNYKCQGNHTDFSSPSTLLSTWWSSKMLRGNYGMVKKKKAKIASPSTSTAPATTTAPPPSHPPPMFGPPTPPPLPPPTPGIPDNEYEFLKQLLIDYSSIGSALHQQTLQLQQQSQDQLEIISDQQQQILQADNTIQERDAQLRSLTIESNRQSLAHNKKIKHIVDESLKKNFYLSPQDLTTRAVNSFAPPNQFDASKCYVRRDSSKKVARRCKLYVENVLLKEQSLFDNHLRISTVNAVCKILREDKFTAFNFLYTMDAHGHVLSLKAISVIRKMQELDKFSRNCIFVSASSISRCARVIEQYGKSIVNYEITNVSEELGSGERLEFNVKQALPLILKSTKLDILSQSGKAVLSGSMDGVAIWKGYDLIIYGVKNNSDLGCTPFTKKPNLSVVDGKIHSCVQSPENCFVLKVVQGSENKAMVEQEFIPCIRQLKEENALHLKYNKLLAKKKVLEDIETEFGALSEDEQNKLSIIMDKLASTYSFFLGEGFPPLWFLLNADMSGKFYILFVLHC
jgi:hypothetical protein